MNQAAAVVMTVAPQRALDDGAKRMWDKKIRVRIGIHMGKSVRRGKPVRTQCRDGRPGGG